MTARRGRRSALTIGAIVAASTLVGAAPAFAAPWDGSDVPFGPGSWAPNSDYFNMDDVELLLPDTTTEYTDIWDGTGTVGIVSAQLNLDHYVWCSSDDAIDIVTDGDTGDLVITCTPENQGVDFASAGLAVTSEIRVLAGGDVVRFTTAIENVGDADALIDAVELETNFGSSGFLYDYDNQSDATLAVPADETGGEMQDQLNSVGAQWFVHWEADDAPGGVVIGAGSGAASPATWSYVFEDDYFGVVGPFTIPAGASRSVVTFSTWHPQSLIDGDYTQDSTPDPLLMNASADAIVDGMSEFSSLSGRLAAGLDPASPVVNWQSVAEEEPELAETGAADVLAAGVLALIALAAGGVLVARRRATV